MKISTISKQIGISYFRINQMCINNELEYSYEFDAQGRFVKDIDEKEIPKIFEILKKRNYNRELELKKAEERAAKKPKKAEHTDFKKLMKKLDKYNREHGTNYSYGKATALGII